MTTTYALCQWRRLESIALCKCFVSANRLQNSCQSIAEAGYATDPDYAEKSFGVIETYHLNQYDQ